MTYTLPTVGSLNPRGEPWTAEAIDMLAQIRKIPVAAGMTTQLTEADGYVLAIEANRHAKLLIAEERWAAQQRDLAATRRQAAIDSVWAQTLAAREDARSAGSFHRAPGEVA